MSENQSGAPIVVRELNHFFGPKQVLKNINFEVAPGTICVIMGASGGGKTTLLKVMSGLLESTSGSVSLGKHNEIQAGLVFQYAALFDSLTVRDNVLFGVRRQRKLKRNEEEELLSSILTEVGLVGTEDMLPNELSGGMRKRVGLARALCMSPNVLLYDEPTSGLDPVTAYSIDRLIVETCRHTGVTSVVVSHDVTSVLRVADQIIFLNQGEIAFDGTPDEFKQQEDETIAELVLKARSEELILD